MGKLGEGSTFCFSLAAYVHTLIAIVTFLRFSSRSNILFADNSHKKGSYTVVLILVNLSKYYDFLCIYQIIIP